VCSTNILIDCFFYLTLPYILYKVRFVSFTLNEHNDDNAKVTESLKSDSIWESYAHMKKRSSLFMTHSVDYTVSLCRT